MIRRWRKKIRSGWVFVEWQTAECRECGTFLAHSWNHSIGLAVKGALCTACVAPHISVSSVARLD